MTVSNRLAWLLDDLTQRVPHVQHALVLSNDGLVTGASGGLDRQAAEHLAAVSSGFHSLAKGAGRQFGTGGVRQTMVEFDEGYLFVTAAGDGSCLSVLSGMAITDAGSAVAAAESLRRPIVVVTSVPVPSGLGTLLVAADTALLATTPKLSQPPRGAGDLIAALLFGHMVAGRSVGEALELMRPGDEWIVWVPPQLGYGDRDVGPIPANSVLRFKLVLHSVTPAG